MCVRCACVCGRACTCPSSAHFWTAILGGIVVPGADCSRCVFGRRITCAVCVYVWTVTRRKPAIVFRCGGLAVPTTAARATFTFGPLASAASSGPAASALSRRFVYLLVQVRVPGGSEDFSERVVVELFDDVVPKTAENFRCLCTGERVRASVAVARPLPIDHRDASCFFVGSQQDFHSQVGVQRIALSPNRQGCRSARRRL
jgi:hypothetical protein